MGKPLVHYEAQDFHGDKDIALLDDDGKLIRIDAVVYESKLALDIVTFLNWRRLHPEVDLVQALTC